METISKEQLSILLYATGALTVIGTLVMIFHIGSFPFYGIVEFFEAITPSLYTGIILGVIFANYKP